MRLKIAVSVVRFRPWAPFIRQINLLPPNQTPGRGRPVATAFVGVIPGATTPLTPRGSAEINHSHIDRGLAITRLSQMGSAGMRALWLIPFGPALRASKLACSPCGDNRRALQSNTNDTRICGASSWDQP